jgi:uncharacterized protein (TIGR03435 family)
MKRLSLAVAACALLAQQPPAFEVASVKPNTTGGAGAGTQFGNDRIEIHNYSLRQLIRMAYRVHDYAYAGPSWLDSLHFDVVAKVPTHGKFDQVPEMMQTLLAERFKLAVHRETREVNGLALVVDKKGPRIQPVEPGPNSGSGWGSNMVQGTNISMAQFADLLSNALDRPVKDLTSLPGVYNIRIRWLPDAPAPADTPDLAGSVYAAVQDQLGLRLQVQKLPVEVLVVDRAERVPTEN